MINQKLKLVTPKLWRFTWWMQAFIKYWFFHQIFVSTFNVTDVSGIIADIEVVYKSFKRSFFMLFTVKYFQIFPKHNWCGYNIDMIFRGLCLELMDLYTISIPRAVSQKLCRLKRIFSLNTVIAVPSNPCVGTSPVIMISFFLSSVCNDTLLSTPKLKIKIFEFDTIITLSLITRISILS